jgi:hypothetical protein
MNEQDLRDCFAMFAMLGLMTQGENEIEFFPETAYGIADAMLEARKASKEQGIAAAKPKRVRKS